MTDLLQAPVAVLGLGYVGLPLALAFAKVQDVVAFDIDAARIAALRQGRDVTGEASADDFAAASTIRFTADPAELAGCGTFIVTVPTPVDASRKPDLGPLRAASLTVAGAMGPCAVVVYESTVYPGCTRTVCVPILEEASGLKADEDFAFGYSPERINPGDTAHRLADIVKVTSGSTAQAAEAIDALYARIVTAGTHRAPSVEVAEAAKVIENTQRDLNIALMNELAILFHRLDLDTHAVLEAAGSKWNFLPFRPGLVGGHCIGVDPYYLTFRAEEVGHHPEVILAGRRINDRMAHYVVDRICRLMMGRKIPVVGSSILLMGIAFKEDCGDVRNSGAVEIARELMALNANVTVWDPCVVPHVAARETGLAVHAEAPQEGDFDAVVVAVAHRPFAAYGIEQVRALCAGEGVVFDVKGMFREEDTDGRL